MSIPSHPASKPKRRTPVELVNDSNRESFRAAWFRQLKQDDQAYVLEVVTEIIKNPEAMLILVARNLIIEFSFKFHTADTIAAGLEEMVRYAKAVK